MADKALPGWKSVTGWTGRRSFRLAGYPVDLSLFIAHALRRWVARGHLRDPLNRRMTMAQVLEAGVDPLPAILIVGLLVGFSFAAPLVALMPALAESELAPLLLRVIGLELGPLLTATVLVGRAGRAMSVELANMQLHGESRGLQRLGIDLYAFFAAPRVIATAIAQLVLSTYFTTVALVGGVPLASLLYAGESGGLALATLSAVETGELAVFIVKNLVFGLVIAGAACFSAVQVRVAPTEVPQRAQQAATNSLVLVFVINALVIGLTL